MNFVLGLQSRSQHFFECKRIVPGFLLISHRVKFRLARSP